LARALNCCKIAPDEPSAKKVFEHLQYLKSLPFHEPQTKPFNERKLSHVTFVPNNECNFRCSYCYARHARSSEKLSTSTAIAVINYLLEKAIPGQEMVFGFIGGGEPTLDWSLICEIFDYAAAQSVKRGIKPSFKLSTNGSMLDDERVAWLAKRGLRVSISFEVLPDVQNHQRPGAGDTATFDVVDANIMRLLAAGVKTGIRTTVTECNVGRLSETVAFMAKRYPEIRYIRMEPVFEASTDLAAIFKSFVPGFLAARKLGKSANIAVNCSFSKNLARRKARFCDGEFCVTPDGTIVSCHRVISPDEKWFDVFKYGKVTGQRVEVDSEAFARRAFLSRSDENDCDDCFARWHCAGNCALVKLDLPRSSFVRVCNMIRLLYAGLLAQELGLD
jgi:radical SAM protein with 4Fe4S-binding SPASM domain